MTTPTLTELQERILTFEAKWEGRSGSKDAAVLDEFGWSHAAYMQKLNWLIDLPAAEIAQPSLVHRLLARRDTRTQKRAQRRFA